MMRLLRGFRRDDSGATTIEYALIASIVSIIVAVGLTNIGTATQEMYAFLVDNLVPASGAD